MKTLKTLLAVSALAVAVLLNSIAFANLGAEDGNESTDPNWQEGRKAVEAQDWNKAVDLLSKAAAVEPNNADIQNWLGFTHRKLGNMKAAFSAYGEALRLNPQHRHAHEYIGEAYLLSSNLAKAEEHLAQLQKLCSPIPCEEYKELKRAVEEYKKKK